MGFFDYIKEKILDFQRPSYDARFEAMIYNLANFMVKNYDNFELVFTSSKDDLIGNLVYDASQEECQNNFQGYIDDCALFFATLRHGGEILFFINDDETTIRVIGFIQDKSRNSIAPCPQEFIEERLPLIRKTFSIPNEVTLLAREVPTELLEIK